MQKCVCVCVCVFVFISNYICTFTHSSMSCDICNYFSICFHSKKARQVSFLSRRGWGFSDLQVLAVSHPSGQALRGVGARSANQRSHRARVAAAGHPSLGPGWEHPQHHSNRGEDESRCHCLILLATNESTICPCLSLFFSEPVIVGEWCPYPAEMLLYTNQK